MGGKKVGTIVNVQNMNPVSYSWMRGLFCAKGVYSERSEGEEEGCDKSHDQADSAMPYFFSPEETACGLGNKDDADGGQWENDGAGDVTESQNAGARAEERASAQEESVANFEGAKPGSGPGHDRQGEEAAEGEDAQEEECAGFVVVEVRGGAQANFPDALREECGSHPGGPAVAGSDAGSAAAACEAIKDDGGKCQDYAAQAQGCIQG